jgi:hypothetical protein
LASTDARSARAVGIHLFAHYYAEAVKDLFSVPLGYVDPDQGPEDGFSTIPAVPDEAFDHRGKWVALRGAKLDIVRDTREELLEALGKRRSEVVLFHVPTTDLYAL